MPLAKRPGREKLTKIEQMKVRGLEWGPQVEQTALMARPVYIGQAQREEKNIKRGAKGLRVSLQCTHAHCLPLSLTPTLSLSHTHSHSFSRSLFSSPLLGRHALMARGCIFLLFSKYNWAVTWSCNTESCNMPTALTSFASNLCCDKSELRKLHTLLTG